MSKPLASRRLAPAFAALVCAAVPAAHAQVTVPLYGSTDYMTGGDVYANQTAPSPHRATQTFAINSSTTTSTTRALTVAAGTHVNGGTLGGPGVASWTGTMPEVFVGFTGQASGSNISSSLTIRTQFQNSAGGDFIHVNTYQESGTNTIAAGLTYRLAAAIMFEAPAPVAIGNLTDLAYATGGTSYAAGTTATHRVVVRDSASGTFYVSAASNFAASGSISLTGSEWATLSSSDLRTVGAYAPASFAQIDYIGIYSDSSVTTASNITGYTRVNGFTLAQLSYSAIPEPSSAAALFGAIALAGAASRRRRSA